MLAAAAWFRFRIFLITTKYAIIVPAEPITQLNGYDITSVVNVWCTGNTVYTHSSLKPQELASAISAGTSECPRPRRLPENTSINTLTNCITRQYFILTSPISITALSLV